MVILPNNRTHGTTVVKVVVAVQAEEEVTVQEEEVADLVEVLAEAEGVQTKKDIIILMRHTM
jgi:hypothetical protein